MIGGRSRSRLVVVIVPILALVACQSAPSTATPGTAAPTSPQGSGSASTGSLETSQASLPPGFVVGPGDLLLDDPSVGLDALASHRATLTVSFEGTTVGEPSTWRSKAVLLAASDPRAAALTIETTGGLEGNEPSWAAEVEGITYGLDPDGVCTAEVAELAIPAVQEPAALLTALVGADLAGRESIGAVEVDSYTFDERALGFLSDAKATGRISIATAGGYIVRYEVTTTGGPDYFGEGVTGKLSTIYELSDIGAPVTIDLPADCPTGVIELALPTDATAVLSVPGLLSYLTQASVEDAAGLIQASALIAHWTPVGENVIRPEIAHLAFDNGGTLLDVFVTPTEGGTQVEILGRRGG